MTRGLSIEEHEELDRLHDIISPYRNAYDLTLGENIDDLIMRLILMKEQYSSVSGNFTLGVYLHFNEENDKGIEHCKISSMGPLWGVDRVTGWRSENNDLRTYKQRECKP